MTRYHYKLVCDAVSFCGLNREELCEYMAEKCSNTDGHFCTIGYLSCPFSDKSCRNVTADDWMKVLVPSTEAENA